jgi:hypothetical protein
VTGRPFGPSRAWGAAPILISHVLHVRAQQHVSGTEKGLTMKHIAGKALGAAGFLVVIAALVAGKDDIRKFRRMRSM